MSSNVDIADLINKLSEAIEKLSVKFNDLQVDLAKTLTDHGGRIHYVELSLVTLGEESHKTKGLASQNTTRINAIDNSIEAIESHIIEINEKINEPKKARAEYIRATIKAVIAILVGAILTEFYNVYIHLPKSERAAIERSVEARR